MKESGINFFVGALGIPTGTFGVFYTFEDGAGTKVSSISGGQSQFSGVLSAINGFWSSPGSGFFSGAPLTISNASGLDSTTWTKLFVYEKTSVNPVILFDSLAPTSGYRIGLNHANRPYLESINGEPVCAASANNYSSKAAVTVSYVPNYLTIGLYDFSSQQLESESWSLPFGIARADNQLLGSSFTGYLDYYLHFTAALSPQTQTQLLSGLFAHPTGFGSTVQTICTTGITGTQPVFVGQTGITGYLVTPGGDEGRDYFTGAFPLSHSTAVLTGYLNSGIIQSGVTGFYCYPVTGAPTYLFQYLTGYAASFGMEKINLFAYVEPADVTKTSVARDFADTAYNLFPLPAYSGYALPAGTDTGILDLFMNGVAQAGTGWVISNDYLFLSGATSTDAVYYDAISGGKKAYPVTGTSFVFTYSGQELYLNGVNLISGRDFTAGAGSVTLTSAQTGISGVISEYPVVLVSNTGTYTLWTGARFDRDTSNVYLNGVRQANGLEYIEGGVYDLLSGNRFNPLSCSLIYDDNDLYWTTS